MSGRHYLLLALFASLTTAGWYWIVPRTYTRAEVVDVCVDRFRELRPELRVVGPWVDLLVAGSLDEAHRDGRSWTDLARVCREATLEDLDRRGVVGVSRATGLGSSAKGESRL